ncbi:MAG: BatA domain-containing protein [bacterium]
MHFLHPWYLLAAAAAAALPWLFHLLGRRRLPRVRFSDLRYLERIRARSLRRVRLRSRLLLLLRSLVLFLLVAALARPVVGEGSAGPARVLLAIDRSASMSYRTGEETVMDRARRTASALVDAWGPEDRIVLAAGPREGRPLAVLARERGDADGRERLKRLIAEVEAGAEGLDGSGMVAEGVRLLGEAGGPGPLRELVVVSDMAGPSWGGPPAAAPAAAPGGPGNRVIRVPVGASEPRNTGLIRLELDTALPGRGGSVTLRADLRALGEDARVEVTLEREGGAVGRRRIELEAGGEGDAFFRTLLPSAGLHIFTARLPEDRWGWDDTAFLPVHLPETLRAVLIRGRGEDASHAADALAAGAEEGWFSLREGGRRRSSELLADADVAVVAGVDEPGEVLADALEELLEEGGSVLALPGPRSDLGAWQAALGEETGLRLMGVRRAPPGSAWELQASDEGAGLVRPLFREEVPEGLARVLAVMDLRAPGGTPLLVLNEGSPVVTEHAVGRGRLILWGLPLDPAWSDLVPGPGPVLLVRAVRHLGGAAREPDRLHAGASWRVGIGAEDLREEWRLTGPEGLEGTLLPAGGDRSSLETGSLTRPGAYTLWKGSEAERLLVVSVDPDEGDLVPRTPGDLWDPEGWAPEVLPPGRQDARGMAALRTGTGLWRLFITAALVLLAAEVILGRRAYGAHGPDDA